VLDTFVEQGRDFTQGKFGFLIQGNDEIAISNFKFLTAVTNTRGCEWQECNSAKQVNMAKERLEDQDG